MNAPAPSSSAARDLSDLVEAVFENWRAGGIEFLVLRNYEGLPRETRNDIDVLVTPGQLAQAERLLIENARRIGYRLHNRAEFGPVSLFFFHPDSLWQIHFDLFFNVNWRGLSLLSPREVLTRRTDRGLFAVPHPVHEAMINLLSRLLLHRYVKEEYKAGIQAAIQNDPAEATTQLRRMFGPTLAKSLTEKILAGRWTDVEARIGAMRRELIWRSVTRQPFATLASLIRDLRRYLSRLVEPPGLTIVLLGADGSGKSTVALRLIEALRDSFSPDKGLRVHWKPVVFFRRRRAARPPTTRPHGQPPRGLFASLVLLGYHWLEFLLGALLQFLPVRFRNGLVLIDRYHYDFAIDPLRYRLRTPAWLVRAGFKLLPNPDLVFLLDAPPEVLHQRKQELPVNETCRQRDAYRALVAQLPKGRIVDCERSLDDVVADITRQVLNHLEARQKQRT